MMKEMVEDRSDLHHAWEQQNNMHNEPTAHGAWVAEFDHRQSSATPTTILQTPYTAAAGYNGQLMPMSMYRMNPALNMYQGNYVNNAVSEVKGKGKEREVDFEAAFAQAAASLSPDQTDTSIEDSVADISNVLDNTSLGNETENNGEFRQSVFFDHSS
jgi:peroxin-5